MRFTIVAAAFVGAVMAHGHGYGEEQSTVYETEVATITSCPPTVPDCPAATATSAPVESETETEYPVETPVETHVETPVEPPVETTLATMPHGNGTNHPTGVPEPECPGYSVKTIHTSVTTVIPTVIYETVDVPCETATHEPTGTGSYIPTGGVASPSTGVPTETPVFTGGAASMGFSFAAAAAGLFAFLA